MDVERTAITDPNGDKRYRCCGKMRHLEATCWSHRKWEDCKGKVALDEADETNSNVCAYENGSSSEVSSVVIECGEEEYGERMTVKLAANW